MLAHLVLASSLACGAERAAVKHVTDAAAVDPVPIVSSVEALAALPLSEPVRGTEPRGVRPEEFHVYTVLAVVGFAKKESDQDAHIVLLDGVSSMIVESVDPRCAARSQLLPHIAAARSELLAAIRSKRLTTGALRKLKGKHVRVTGVGFFDRCHGQTGRAPNCVELHPVLGFEVIE